MNFSTVPYVPELCEPTSICVDYNRLTSTLASISQSVGYTTLEWQSSPIKQSSLSLTYPPVIPQQFINRWGDLAYYRCVGNELEFRSWGFSTSDMSLMTELVSNSYIRTISELILDYHNRTYNCSSRMGRIHLATLGPGTAFGLHRDQHTTTRYHIAITTNELCHMLVSKDSEIFTVHIPCDSRVWHLDTQCLHSAQNLSCLDTMDIVHVTRSHLIFSIC